MSIMLSLVLQVRLASHNKRHLVITILLLWFRTTSQNKKLLVITIMACPQRAGPLSGLNLCWDSVCCGCAHLLFKKPCAGTTTCPKKIGTPNGFWITTDEISLCALQFVHDIEHEKFGNYIKIYEDKWKIHENTQELTNTRCKFI